MAVLGFSLNNISLFGLVLAIGIVVDDAIVVVENVERWLEHGAEPREATRKAMDEVTGPVIAVALVLCAVFVPCAFIGGITGQFFRQFAVTIAVSTTFSAINSLTLSPALAAILLKPRDRAGQDAAATGLRAGRRLAGVALRSGASRSLDCGVPRRRGRGLVPRPVAGSRAGVGLRLFNRAFAAGTRGYAWAVGRLLRLSVIVLLAYAGLVGLTYWVFEQAPTGFVPEQDQGRLIVNVQLPDSASLERHAGCHRARDQDHPRNTGVDATQYCGHVVPSDATSPNFGSMFVMLHPFEKRRDPSLRDTAIMARLRRDWAEEVKDAEVTVFGAPPIPGLSVAGGFKLMVEDRGGLGPEPCRSRPTSWSAKMRSEPGLVGIISQFRSNTPQLFLDIDRTKVESLGVSLGDVNQTLEIYLGSLYVNSFNEFGRHWQVTVQAEGDFRNEVSRVNLLQVRNKSGPDGAARHSGQHARDQRPGHGHAL